MNLESHPAFKVTTSRDQSVTITISSLLWNASDPDGDAIDFYFVDATSSEGGTINDPGGAWFTYTPPAGFTGVDRFTYNIKDELGAELTSVIEVEVVEFENPPLIFISSFLASKYE